MDSLFFVHNLKYDDCAKTIKITVHKCLLSGTDLLNDARRYVRLFICDIDLSTAQIRFSRTTGC